MLNLGKFSNCQVVLVKSMSVFQKRFKADHFRRYFRRVHSVHSTRGQCIPLRNTIPWKTCLWKDKYFFNSKPLEVYLFWWEKENSTTVPTVMCTKLTDKRRKTGNRNDWRLMLVFIPGAKEGWDLPRSPGLCESQGRAAAWHPGHWLPVTCFCAQRQS